MEITVLAHPKSENFERVSAAVRQARLLQGEFVPRLVEAPWLPKDAAMPRNAAVLRDEIRERHPREKTLAIVDCRLIPDLLVCEFSGVSVVTTYDWNEKFAPPAVRYHLLYQFASAFLNFAADLSDPMIDGWAHKNEPAGCVFDWYNDKSELLRAMIAGRVCLDHRGMLAKMGASPAAIAAAELLLLDVRSAAIGQRRDLGASVFIGHGHSDDWRAVLDWLRDGLELQVEEFNLKPNVGVPNTILLGRMLDQAAVAIMVMTPEVKHEDGTWHARENILHEIGLLQGRLGFERVAILKEETVKSFSNIDGLTVIPFKAGQFANSPDVQAALCRFLERERLVEPLVAKKKPKRRRESSR
jgi:predicted nucleotide-binding protein